MGRSCTVCDLGNRHLVDHALLAGEQPLAAIAREHGVSGDALRRHRSSGHIPRLLTRLAGEVERLTADHLVTELVDAYDRALAMCAEAESSGWDPRDRVAAVKETRSAIESLAKVGLALADRRERVESSAARPDLDEAVERALRRLGERDASRAFNPAEAPDVVDAEIVNDSGPDSRPAYERALLALPAAG